MIKAIVASTGLMLCVINSSAIQEMDSGKFIPSIDGIAIQSAHLSELTITAIDGSGEDALKIANHCLMTQNNRPEAIK